MCEYSPPLLRVEWVFSSTTKPISHHKHHQRNPRLENPKISYCSSSALFIECTVHCITVHRSFCSSSSSSVLSVSPQKSKQHQQTTLCNHPWSWLCDLPTNSRSTHQQLISFFADNFFWQVDCFSTTSAIFLALLLLDTPWISFISHRRPLYSSRRTSTTIDDDHTTIVQPLQCSKLTGTLGSCSKSPGYSQFVFKSTGWISFGTVWYCLSTVEHCLALFHNVWVLICEVGIPF